MNISLHLAQCSVLILVLRSFPEQPSSRSRQSKLKNVLERAAICPNSTRKSSLQRLAFAISVGHYLFGVLPVHSDISLFCFFRRG